VHAPKCKLAEWYKNKDRLIRRRQNLIWYSLVFPRRFQSYLDHL